MNNFDAIIRAAKAKETEPETTKSIKDNVETQPAVRPLADILERETNTRELNQAHVKALAESIAILGLLEPLVLDVQNRLLAGGHRLAAIKLLSRENILVYKKLFPSDLIPVQALPFDAEQEPDRALRIEIAENEHRRDYTPAEVRALADRLRSAGYIDQAGRPAKGAKALRPALEVIVGKSLRTVQRYLNEDQSQSQKQQQDFVSVEQKALRQVLKKLKELNSITTDEVSTPKRQAFRKQLPKLMELVEAAIKEFEEFKE